MVNNNTLAVKFIGRLLEHPKVKDLENYDDSGVKVSIHTYDVLKCCESQILKDFKNLEVASKKIEFFDLIIGVIIHDLSKGSIRKEGEDISHSQMMVKNPDYVVKECQKLLEEIEEEFGYQLKPNITKNILHIVVSHHGRWGKIQPGSREAHIVHKADEYSAKYHRINPVASDKILKLMVEGFDLEEIGKLLSCTSGILKDRLKRTKQELNIKNTKQLVGYYKKNKKVPLGDEFFEKRIIETDSLIKLVTKEGVKKLVLDSDLINYLEDSEIFNREI